LANGASLPFYCETERPTFPTIRQPRAEFHHEMMMCDYGMSDRRDEAPEGNAALTGV
jgi:hypothetical protein